ncbi:MAG: phosphotransferase family protein [Myxococcota bacterium]
MSQENQRIEALISQEAGAKATITRLDPLHGGACQDNLRIEVRIDEGSWRGEHRLVLRSDAPRSLPGSLDRADEFAVIRAATAAGVRTPEALWLGKDVLREGAAAYVMRFVEGVGIGQKVLKSKDLAAARAGLPRSLAEELAKIHGITAIKHPELFPKRDRKERVDPVGATLDDLRASLDQLPRPRPALEYAWAWLSANRPDAHEVTLVHGDFRTGNFLVAPAGLVAVLDWEFSHFGSPLEDLAWIAVRDWRFGELAAPIGGFTDRATFYREYERASGRSLNRSALHYWEIVGNVKWASGALLQGERYLSGTQRDLELIAIARRAVEMEWEALRLIRVGPEG